MLLFLFFVPELTLSYAPHTSYNYVSGKKSHKGRGKQFSNPEEIDRQMKAQKELVSERLKQREDGFRPGPESD